jgi:transcriptional regulator with XRE-family HTH domain
MNRDVLRSPSELGRHLKQLRVAHDRTVQSVAEQSGLSKSFVSMVESGARAVKFRDLRQILACYEYSIAWFLTQIADGDGDKQGNASFFHHAHAIVQPRNQTLVLCGNEGKEPSLRLLRLLRHKSDAELLELTLPPRSQFGDVPMTVEAEIRGVVQHGTLLLVIGQQMKHDEHIVRTGDEFCFDGSEPHIFRNYTNETTITTLVITPPAL